MRSQMVVDNRKGLTFPERFVDVMSDPSNEFINVLGTVAPPARASQFPS